MVLFPKLTVCLLWAASLSTATTAFAKDALSWSPPFGDMDKQTEDDALIVLVFTNDVPRNWLDLSKVKRDKRTADFWCEDAVVQAAGRIDPAYFHPSAPICWQPIQLGLPPILTGGKPHGDVPRTFTVVTDGQYRFLEMIVGVPEQTALSNLIEDAEETRMWLRHFCSDPDTAAPMRMLDAIITRNRHRLGRVWNEELESQKIALGEEAFHSHLDGEIIDPLNAPVGFTELVRTRLGSIANQLQITYLHDAQLRFGLIEQRDVRRLAILEQHTDTRRSWANCLSPFLAGTDFREIYTQLAELIWGCRVMPLNSELTSEGESRADARIATWIEGFDDDQPFVLQLPLSFLAAAAGSRRTQISPVALRRGLGWSDLDTELQKLPKTQTDLLQLATWLHHAGGRPIDLDRPCSCQILFFRSATDPPFLIRDGEPPGRSITMIRKVLR